MPEGPTIAILREQAQGFAGRKVLRVEGNTSIDKERLRGLKLVAVRSWGKHFLLQFPKVSLRVHFMLFGSYRINERKDTPARLGLGFANGELNFYACSVKLLDEPLDAVYDWRTDVMSESWDETLARKRVRARPEAFVCDVMLDQEIFAGAGNIFKNEVLFRIRVHPLSRVGALPAPKLRELAAQTRQYAFDFYQWKKAFVLKKHWLAHTRTVCPRCDIPFSKGHLGETRRRSFYCANCQVLYDGRSA